MIAAVGDRVCAVFRRTAPDPFVLAVGLTVVAAVLSIAFGYRAESGTIGQRATWTLDAWIGLRGGGLWSLLAFSMQMCVVLVTGSVLASSPPVGRLLTALAGVPRTGRAGAAMVACVACAAGVVNWGLGLVVGAILAREVGRSLSRRGISHSYPLLAAAGYLGMMVWHGGLSGSGPLSVTTVENAVRSLPRELVEASVSERGIWDGGWIGLDETIGSGMNLVVTGGLLVLLPLVVWMLGAGRAPEGAGFERFIEADRERAVAFATADRGLWRCVGETIPEWLERTPWVTGLLALLIVAGMARFVHVRGGVSSIGLNEISVTMLALGLLAHGSARSFLRATEHAAEGCAGIIVQFPLYAGMMSMLQQAGLISMVAEWTVGLSNARTLPLLSYLSAAVVNLFVPSGGGQWAIQGPIAIEAGRAAGVPLEKMVMSVAYGDQLTNMLQPFWALPLLAITRVRARDIVGYTSIAMVVGGVWIAIVLVVM